MRWTCIKHFALFQYDFKSFIFINFLTFIPFISLIFLPLILIEVQIPIQQHLIHIKHHLLLYQPVLQMPLIFLLLLIVYFQHFFLHLFLNQVIILTKKLCIRLLLNLSREFFFFQTFTIYNFYIK